MTREAGSMDPRDLDVRGAALHEIRARLDELVAAHRRTVQQERVSAFREMAGELAHDFNDTLSGLLARAQILLANVQDPLVRRSLRMIEQVVLEGASTVRRLQDFSRRRPARPLEPLDLNQLVSEIVTSVRVRWSERLAARNISGEVHAETAPLPLVAGDAAELRHVLTTIADNALDAMPDGGTLTFCTSTDGERVACHVADTGASSASRVKRARAARSPSGCPWLPPRWRGPRSRGSPRRPPPRDHPRPERRSWSSPIPRRCARCSAIS